MPIWVANFVLMDYGTGAIMAVPAHDQRDFEFARKYGLPVQVVVQPPEGETSRGRASSPPTTGSGEVVNSGEFDGLPSEEAHPRMTAYAETEGFGKAP